jgi:hypothetical protein
MRWVSNFCTIFDAIIIILLIHGLGSKKALILIFFIFNGILNHSYANEYSIFEKDNKKGLKNKHGKQLIPPVYEEIGWSDGSQNVIDDVIGYRLDGQWGIINTKNTNLTSAEFSEVIPCNKNNIIASKPDSYKLNSLFGLINYSGKTIIDFKYSSLRIFGANFIVSKKFNNNIFYGLINQKDELIIPLKYIAAKFITPDIVALKDQRQIINLINSSGKSLMDVKIDDVEIFADKFLIISSDGNKGMIDFNGRMVAPLEYQQFHINENGFLNALSSKIWDILSYKGNVLNTLKYDQIIPVDSSYYKAKRMNYAFIINDKNQEIFRIRNSGIRFLNDSLALINAGNRFGVINYNADTIVQPNYDSITISGNRLFLYSKKINHTGWKMVDLYGIQLTSLEFEDIYRLDAFNLAFKKNGFWGIIDNYGTEKIIAKYDSIYSKMNDLYLVDFYGEKGVVDQEGKWKVYPQKGDVYLLQNGDYLISSYFQSRVINRWGNDLYISENYLWPFKWGFIEEDFEQYYGLLDRRFRNILPVENSFVAPIVKDSVFLFNNEQGWGMVDLSGKILFKNDKRFEQIIGYHESFVGVKIDGLYGFIDLNGKLRIANRYEGISLFNEGLANIKILGKWGCVNKVEDIVVQPYFDEIRPFENGMAIASKINRYGILNDIGRNVIEFEYDSIYRIKNGNFICVLNKKYGLINNHGEIIFYPKYDSILDLNNGYVIAERRNKYGVFSSSGVFIIPVKYDQIFHNPYRNVFLASQNPEWETILNINHSKLY